MCLAIPYKVISTKDGKIELDMLGEKRTAQNSLIEVNPKDFVLVQNNTIIKKLTKKEAKETLKLFSRK